MDILSSLFGSEGRIKIMRLFLFNPRQVFDAKQITLRTKLKSAVVRKEINALEKATLINKKSIRVKKKSTKGWFLNPDFRYLGALQGLLINTASLDGRTILKKMGKIGRLKVLVVAGVFIQDWDSRADMLLVADKIKPKALDKIIKKLEAEIGKELKYTALETGEFHYRLNYGDKLVRDILDYPHEVLLDKFGNLS